ncbi:sugar ABC transporter ATP-binding protein [Streptomyces sp. NPDC096012]|uniref:sugar ABC transporter ATP-binding protein n=1 Tax=Streptomyces sp. NPDC096012 TaxID=3155684 RepID=UPI00336A1CFF
MSAPLLEMQGVVKEFPGVRALDGVDLDVVAGEVHCLLGQNGAGKSTLIKVLAGAHQPDEGHIAWEGEPVTLPTPTAAMRHGIATIYQELDLADGLSVAENIYLGHEQSRLGFARRSRMHDAARQLLRRLGHPEIPVTREVGELSAAGKQLVSMARALSHDARLLIMDEPSAVLAHDEVDNLFRIIGDLTAAGVGVVYISHRMEEIRRIGDRVTVLKDGRTVARGLPARTTPTSELVSLMTGRTVEYVFPPRPESPGPEERPVLLEVEQISRPGEFHDISFTVRAGEIVGLAGLVGSGRSEILETVYGARRPASGRISMAGSVLRPGSVTAAVRAGLGLAPEERKSQALFMQSSIAHNVSMSSLRRFARAGFLDARTELAATTEAVRRLDLRPPDATRPVRTLSGGNQQKAVVARWLLTDCRLLLLDEPTRGVDVGARAELYMLIRRLADSGVGVLLVSSEVPEVLGLADRVLVMREGRVVREAGVLDLDESKVLDLVMEGSSA